MTCLEMHIPDISLKCHLQRDLSYQNSDIIQAKSKHQHRAIIKIYTYRRKKMKKISAFLAIMIVLSTLFSVSAFAIDSLDFTWGDRVSIENTESSPMVCSQTIKNCTSLTFNYSVD